MSVDTYRASVAARALAAGASVVNDVSGGLADPEMAAVVRDAGCPWILMHWRGHSDHDAGARALRRRGERRAHRAAARASTPRWRPGVTEHRLVIDPGLGFAKTAAHNWALLARLDSLVELGLPVLVAASRKSFLGSLLAGPDGPRPVDEREDATTALTAYCAEHGAWGVRVHEVRPSVDAALTIAEVQRG